MINFYSGLALDRAVPCAIHRPKHVDDRQRPNNILNEPLQCRVQVVYERVTEERARDSVICWCKEKNLRVQITVEVCEEQFYDNDPHLG